MSQRRNESFQPQDVLIVASILGLGGIGYLCDAHSPLAVVFIPFCGAFFSLSLLALVGVCTIQVISKMTLFRLIVLSISAAFVCLVLGLAARFSGVV